MKQIPMLDLNLEYKYMKADIDGAISKCFEHQRWILGPEVKELEEKIAGYLGTKHCLGVSSGTEALVLSLRALAIKTRGKEYFDKTDEIITTPFTFIATGEAVLRAGARPVFVDIDPETYNINNSKIMEYLKNDSSKVVGIIPVHLYGRACNMDEIMEIAEEHNLFVIEDVAHAFGGMWNGKKLGSIGTAGAFSFFPSKNLGSFGDAGMVSTNDYEIAEIVRMLLRHGGRDKYNVEHIGYNARLDTIQSAVLLAKLKYVDEFNEKRRKIAGLYTKGLSDIKDIICPASQSHNLQTSKFYHVYHQYTVRINHGKRDELQRYLKDNGISTSIYYPIPLHKMMVFGNNRSKIFNGLDNAEQASLSVLSLPNGPLQAEKETAYIVDCIKKYLRSDKVLK